MIWTAFIVGLLGSLHCVGMCGPIALALPSKGNSGPARLLSGIIYSAGRIVTYSVLGLLIGLIGESIALAGYQQWLSIVLGVAIVVLTLTGTHLLIKIPAYQRLIAKIRSKLGFYLKRHTYRSLFGIGVLNGLLPCGLIYVALFGALATGDMLSSSLYMMLFGAGTVPLMLAVNVAGKLLPQKIRSGAGKAVPVFIITIGLLLIVRGANLGIPYLSPKVENSIVSSCCEKK